MASNLAQATTDVNRLHELVAFFNKIVLGDADMDATIDGETRPVLAKLAASFLLGMDTYETVADGLAGAGEGGFFQVVSDLEEEYTILYQDVNGVAVERKRYPSYALAQLVIDARDIAVNAAASAESDAAIASSARDQSVAASEASGDVQFFDTKALADAATLTEGDVVEVFADESRDGGVARYRYESGVLVFKWQPGQRYVEAASSADTRTQQEWMEYLLSVGNGAVDVTTTTGTQTLADALDARVIYADTIADRDALPTAGLTDGQALRVVGAGDFRWDSTTSKWLPDSDTVTPEMFGGDLVAWAAYPSKKHYGGPGNYASSSDVVFAPGSTVELSEDFVFTGSGQFLCEGTLPEIATLASDVSAGDYALTFSAAHNLSPGDIVRLWSTVDFSWSTHRAYYHAGEDVRVHSVTSATEVSLAAPLMYSYLAADMRCFTFGANKGFRLTGGTFVNSDSGYSIQARHLVGVEIHPHKLTADTLGTGGVSIDKCYSIGMSCRYANVFSPDSGLQYSFIAANSTHWTLTGNGSSTRHVMAIGGDTELGSIPSRHGRINNAVLSGVEATGSDAHGNSDDIIYSQCVINGGAMLGGKDIIYDKCSITEYTPTTGYCVISAEVVGGYYKFIDCTFVTQSNPRATGFGIVNMLNKGSGGVAQHPCSIEIIRPICRAPNHIGGILNCVNDAAAPAMSVFVDAPDFTECPAMNNGPILIQGDGTANFGHIALRSPRGVPNGVGYLDTSSAAINWNNVRSEFPTQFGITVVTGSGGAQAATTASFNHPYPYAPGVAISGDVFYEGGQLAVPIAKTITASSFDATLASASGGALTAATSGTLRWIASAATL